MSTGVCEQNVEQKPSPNVFSVITALIERGRIEEAMDFLVNVVILAEAYDVDNMEVLKLTVDEYIELMYPKPLPVVRGKWDKIIYGEAAFK